MCDTTRFSATPCLPGHIRSMRYSSRELLDRGGHGHGFTWPDRYGHVCTDHWQGPYPAEAVSLDHRGVFLSHLHNIFIHECMNGFWTETTNHLTNLRLYRPLFFFFVCCQIAGISQGTDSFTIYFIYLCDTTEIHKINTTSMKICRATIDCTVGFKIIPMGR